MPSRVSVGSIANYWLSFRGGGSSLKKLHEIAQGTGRGEREGRGFGVRDDDVKE